ncbi:MAG: hypothetical protein DRN30_00765 [Thermoplasmata archaeon]|nr:MAG: hypothetical protein DRN30_00765 [Thermoplasmata archaeon]
MSTKNQLTVKELIDTLKRVPQNAFVFFGNNKFKVEPADEVVYLVLSDAVVIQTDLDARD